MSFADADGPFHHDRCLGCGPANPKTVGVRLWAQDGRVVGEVTFDEDQTGAPGYVHGGAVATVLDDALGTVPMLIGTPSVTANLSIDYRASISLGATVQIAAWLVRVDGRKVYVAGELRAGDTLLAEATGLFVVAPPERFPSAAPAVGRW